MKALTFLYYDVPSTICLLAGIVYLIKYRKLVRYERLIVLILLANIFVDVSSYILIHLKDSSKILAYIGKNNHFFYNVLMPVERILTLLIYTYNERESKRKRLHCIGMVLVGLSFAMSLFLQQSITELHHVSNIITGLVIAALSYIHLKSILLNSAGQSITLFYFGLANMIYFTLMISAMSALPLAQKIDNAFAGKIYSINIFGYALWSLILIIGILWKKPKI